MSSWIRVASLDDCPPGAAREVASGDRIIALFNVEGTLYAVDGVCAHQGGPLGKGTLDDGVVTCPWHGWQYDVTTGKHLLSSICQETFAVRVEDGEVLVALP